MRVMRNAVFLMVSATTSNGSPLTCSSAVLTTPGPETPTFDAALRLAHAVEGAPPMNGLSSTALANTTSLAQPSPSCSSVRLAVALMICPIHATASMLMPARVDATLTEEHTRSVQASASGMLEMSRRSATVMPFCTSAENPADKVDPQRIRRAVERAGKHGVIRRVGGRRDLRNRRDRHALVHDRDAIFGLNRLARAHERLALT